MSTVATKTGDGGNTDTPQGRAYKASLFPSVVGTLDELNAAIGIAMVDLWHRPTVQMLETAQFNLLSIGASLWDSKTRVVKGDLSILDVFITDYESNPGGFIIPEGRQAAPLHMARAICRRAERTLWAYKDKLDREIDPLLIRYLNRLSDALYVAALCVTPAAPRMWYDVD
jgi:cob(I)alamin adenosyltransferase